MAYQRKPGACGLFVNDKHPEKSDLTGQMDIACPACGHISAYWVNAWRKQTAAGMKWLSVQLRYSRVCSRIAGSADGIYLYFPTASRIIEAVMERGARTHAGEDWRTLPGFHLARARRHLDLLAAGDASEPHLAHAVCRLLMELERDAQVPPAGGG